MGNRSTSGNERIDKTQMNARTDYPSPPASCSAHVTGNIFQDGIRKMSNVAVKMLAVAMVMGITTAMMPTETAWAAASGSGKATTSTSGGYKKLKRYYVNASKKMVFIRAGAHMIDGELAWCINDGAPKFPNGKTVSYVKSTSARALKAISTNTVKKLTYCYEYIYVNRKFTDAKGKLICKTAYPADPTAEEKAKM